MILVGASTRAAAFSARRSGLIPYCADLFADVDLAACCHVVKVKPADYPDGLESTAAELPAGPWLYASALENRPDIVDRLASRRPLWGNNAKVLRRVRDPFEVAGVLARASLPCPRVQRPEDWTAGPDREPSPAEAESACGRWLLKPRGGTGGRGIRPYTLSRGIQQPLAPESSSGTQYAVLGTELSSATESVAPLMSDACVSIRESSCTHYYQEFIEGTSYAALFVAAAGRAALIGLTRQLVGETALGAKPFHYCGSIGPVPTGRGLTEHTARLGAVLAAEFELVGLFGVDGVIADGVFWPVEVNPRYTASVEVLELALGVPLVALHRDACTRGVSWSDIAGRCAASAPIPKPLGKAILYAPQDIETPDFAARINLSLNTVVQKRVCENEPAVLDLRSDGSQITEGQKPPARKRLGISDPIRYGPVLNYAGRWPVPVIADVPHAGERIEAGRPICTVFAEADTVAACRDKLLSAAAEIYAECQAARKAR